MIKLKVHVWPLNVSPVSAEVIESLISRKKQLECLFEGCHSVEIKLFFCTCFTGVIGDEIKRASCLGYKRDSSRGCTRKRNSKGVRGELQLGSPEGGSAVGCLVHQSCPSSSPVEGTDSLNFVDTHAWPPRSSEHERRCLYSMAALFTQTTEGAQKESWGIKKTTRFKCNWQNAINQPPQCRGVMVILCKLISRVYVQVMEKHVTYHIH